MPRVTAMTETISTATGRRDQCFSPSPATSGSSSMAPMMRTGAMNRAGVSRLGGQIGEDRVDPEEGEVGLGRGLDDGGIGLAGGAEGAEEEARRP